MILTHFEVERDTLLTLPENFRSHGRSETLNIRGATPSVRTKKEEYTTMNIPLITVVLEAGLEPAQLQ